MSNLKEGCDRAALKHEVIIQSTRGLTNAVDQLGILLDEIRGAPVEVDKKPNTDTLSVPLMAFLEVYPEQLEKIADRIRDYVNQIHKSIF